MVKASFTPDWKEQIYNLPIYSLTDVARYLDIPLATLRTWVKGRSYSTKTGEQTFHPLIQRPDNQYPQLSFTNLIEAYLLRVIRKHHNIPLNKVRLALDYISQQFNTEHPLISKKFSTDGVDLFVEHIEQLVNTSRSGQLAMKNVLNRRLTRIEWDEREIASRLYPLIEIDGEETASKILTIDPNISFGKPTITGTGVPTQVVTELYNAGDTIEDIASDYNCTPLQIETAILFESNLQAA